MTKKDYSVMKKKINDAFGFEKSKITLLEASKNSFLEFDYIMFSVCGIEYQMNYSYTEKRYILRVFNNNGAIEF